MVYHLVLLCKVEVEVHTLFIFQFELANHFLLSPLIFVIFVFYSEAQQCICIHYCRLLTASSVHNFKVRFNLVLCLKRDITL